MQMHMIEVNCLNTFHHHPLLDQIENNKKKVFILSGAEGGDKRCVRKFKLALKRNNLQFKSRLLTCRELYQTDIFQESVRYNGSLVVMAFPSVYNSKENTLQKILSKIRDKELHNELEIVPLVFDDDIAICEMFRIHQPLRLVGGYKNWWPLLKPIFGRSVGDLHSMVIQKIDSDKNFTEFKTLLARLKQSLMEADEDVQMLGCEYAQEHLSIPELLKIHGSTSAIQKMNRYPSDPLHLSQSQSTICHEDVVNKTATEPGCLFEIRDTSSITIPSNAGTMITKPFPYSKETHVYILHNHDSVTMTKVTLLKKLLLILGYKCMTLQDIPPGEDIIQMALQLSFSSIAAIVVDGHLLEIYEKASATQAYNLRLHNKIKYIPIVINYAENTQTSTTWLNNIPETPIDMNNHHTLWLDKLCEVLDKPFDNKQGVTIEHQITHNYTHLTQIKTIISDMSCQLRELCPPSQRRCLSAIVDDEEVTRFLKQTLHLPKDMNCCLSDTQLAAQTSEFESKFSTDSSSQASSSGSNDSIVRSIRPKVKTYTRVENSKVSEQHELGADCMLKRYSDVDRGSASISSCSNDSLFVHTSHNDDLSIPSDIEDEKLLPLIKEDIARHETVPKYPANPRTFVSGSLSFSSGYHTGSATSQNASELQSTVLELGDSGLRTIQETTFISPEPSELTDEANSSSESINDPVINISSRTKLKEIYALLRVLHHQGVQAVKIISGIALVILFIYTYGVALDIMATSVGILADKKLRERMADIFKNPVTMMMFGILTTMISGSSTFSQSLFIVTVISGVFKAKDAIPGVLASNVGTSVHNIIRHILYRRNTRLLIDELKRHFAAVALPDRIYIVAVVWSFALEMAIGTSSKPAEFLTDAMVNASSVFGFLVSPFSNRVMQNSCVITEMNNTTFVNREGVPFNETNYNACVVRAFSKDIEADHVRTIGCVIAVISTIILRCIFFVVSCLVEKTISLKRSVICLKCPSPWHAFILTIVSQNSTMLNWAYAVRYVQAGVKWKSIKLACICASIGNTVTGLLAFLFATQNVQSVLELVMCNILFNFFAPFILVLFLGIWTTYFFDLLITKAWFAPTYILVLLLIPLTFLLIQINGTPTTLLVSLSTIYSSVSLWTVYALFKAVHKALCCTF